MYLFHKLFNINDVSIQYIFNTVNCYSFRLLLYESLLLKTILFIQAAMNFVDNYIKKNPIFNVIEYALVLLHKTCLNHAANSSPNSIKCWYVQYFIQVQKFISAAKEIITPNHI